MTERFYRMPRTGWSRETLRAKYAELRKQDANWRNGRTFCLVYWHSPETEAVIHEAYEAFFSENALNPTAFPSLKQMEAEVVGMGLNLVNAPSTAVGSLTSGGTDSLLLAVKAARDYAREHRGVTQPEMILPDSAHPALHKAGKYFQVDIKSAPLRDDFRVDVEAVEQLITPNTILLVGSAPQYVQGVIDPITELGALAQKHELLLHVDSCIGGFMLPFVEELGHEPPLWDFRTPGVTSISMDVHKYGYGAKGSSLLLYRMPELRRSAYFIYSEWPGGIYASSGLAGTRSGGAIAAAWAVMHHLGYRGYLETTRQVLELTQEFRQRLEAIDGLYIVGEPAMSLLALASTGPDIQQIADELALKGWHFDRQQNPPSIHLSIMPVHANSKEDFFSDLHEVLTQLKRPSWRKLQQGVLQQTVSTALRWLPGSTVKRLMDWGSSRMGGVPKRSAAMYGMMAALPESGDRERVIGDLLDKLNQPAQAPQSEI